MISTIYIEEEIRNHPVTQKILSRFKDTTLINCERYTEVFNRNSQNFRLQKKKPSLILAKKHSGFVLKAPDDYGIDGDDSYNYYFSHMLNCIYDCRYCFLQGMYRSAHYVLFVNYDSFTNAIDQTLEKHSDQKVWFYSGYDCDSLALDPVTDFTDFILPFFRVRPNAYLEFRTKSTQIRSLLHSKPIPNCVVAFSLSPQNITEALEDKTPSLENRLEAMKKLQNAGWNIGIRFEPLIYTTDYKENYKELFSNVFNQLDVEKIHSISIGAFRVPKSYFKNMTKLYPDEKLFAGPLEENDGVIAYKNELQEEMLDWCFKNISDQFPESNLYKCG
ncbi:MAG: radical SAM protein [Gammaproteobacteria bacterium]